MGPPRGLTPLFSFTTIDPQRAIGYLPIDCACARYGLSARCKPNYGSCVDGARGVPIELLDVAGLVPGAHQGKGLGNKFLDDLRHADALIHVVDVSGTTDAEGKETRGYDPTHDIVWLRAEIVSWIEGNLVERWGAIKRRHVATKATALDTLTAQLSGYGANASHVGRALAALGKATPLETWDPITVRALVSAFVDVKFPTVLALNKIDHPDADAHVARIARLHPPANVVLTSSIAEVFLRRLKKQGFVRYVEGSDVVETREDLIADGDPDGGGLKEADERLRTRIENLRDMVLFRFGGTGVGRALRRAAELLGVVPVFPVKNAHAFPVRPGGGSGGVPLGPPSSESAANGEGEPVAVAGSAQPPASPTADTAAAGAMGAPVFRDCVLVLRGTTVREVARKVIGDAPLAYVEGPGGVRVAEDDLVESGIRDVSPSLLRCLALRHQQRKSEFADI